MKHETRLRYQAGYYGYYGVTGNADWLVCGYGSTKEEARADLQNQIKNNPDTHSMIDSARYTENSYREVKGRDYD